MNISAIKTTWPSLTAYYICGMSSGFHNEFRWQGSRDTHDMPVIASRPTETQLLSSPEPLCAQNRANKTHATHLSSLIQQMNLTTGKFYLRLWLQAWMRWNRWMS